MTIGRKKFTIYQRNACKSIFDDRGRAGFEENDQKNPLQNTTCASRVTRAGNNHSAFVRAEFHQVKTAMC